MKNIKHARRIFIDKLQQVKEFRVIPSEANYVTIEVLEGTSKELCISMLEKNIFIKDLTPKINWLNKQFIRVAIRDEIDNAVFVKAIKSYYESRCS